MRVVLDTNIVVSALLWRGAPYRLLNVLVARADCSLVASTPMLEELARVLLRPYLARRLTTIGNDAATILRDYMTVTRLVTPIDIAPVCRDADDDMVLATALAAKAELIVSGDDDLLTLGRWRDIAIVTAADAIALLKGKSAES